MTFSAFDIMLPIGLGAVFGVVRYMQYVKDAPTTATRLAIKDALTGMAGMGVMTVILKYLNMI